MRHSKLCCSQVFFFVKEAVRKKLFLAILWHLIYNEWLFGSKKKKNFLLSRYLDFCVFVESTNFKICDVSMELLHNRVYFYFHFEVILLIASLEY